MLKLIKKYKYILTVILIIIIVTISLFIKNNLKEKEVVINNDFIVKEEVVIEKEKIKVEIKGAVVSPGLYELIHGSRVKDLIDLAGGILENANTSLINLARILEDEMVVIVYTNEQVEDTKKVIVVEKIVEKECQCEIVTNDACLADNSKEGLINLNTATIEELVTLTGIGEAKANDIIDYRNEHGNFKVIEDLMNVSGIGEAVFEKIKASITT